MDRSLPRPRHTRRLTVVIMAAMAVFAVLRHWQIDQTVMAVAMSVLVYVLAVFIFYGIARLAFVGLNYSLWLAGLVATGIGWYATGFKDVWMPLTTWGMLVVVGFVTGRLSARGTPPGRIYIIGVMVTIVFCILQFAAVWGDLINYGTEKTAEMLAEAERNLRSMGYTPAEVGDNLDKTRKAFSVIVRLIPSATVLSAVTQFSVAYLIFVRWAAKRGMSIEGFRPFVYWKMPFAVMPLIMAAILMRLWGGEALTLVADNTLAMASIFYCITGLALMEFFLRKLGMSRLMKVLFYLFLFITQFVGFFAAALLGLIDSFADWRKVSPARAG